MAVVVAILAGCGNNGDRQAPRPEPLLAPLAGDVGGFGSGDGVGDEALFLDARGIAADGRGGFLVTDTRAHNIRRIDAAARVTTAAGGARRPGSDDGPGATASFNSPASVASDSVGNIYVADTGNQTIRRISPDGIVSTLAGVAGAGGSADGAGATARFSSPGSVAVDRAGTIYVADTGNHTIRSIGPEGIVSTFAGVAGASGSTDGVGAAARFSSPFGVAVDGSGNVYVADTGNHTIRRISPTGLVGTLAGAAGLQGSVDGVGPEARFVGPGSLTVDGAGNVYVIDGQSIRIVSPDGTVSTLACTTTSSTCVDGFVRFYYAVGGIAVDGSGAAFVTLSQGNPKLPTESYVQKVRPDGVVLFVAGRPFQSPAADGAGSAARFEWPTGLAAGQGGDVFVADKNAGSVRRITADAVVTTFASGLRYPNGAAADSAGMLYVTEASSIYNSWDPYPPPARDVISKIASDGQVTILAGSPFVAGSADGQGADARFHEPAGIAIDRSGNLYVADTGNGTIRRITPAGLVSTLAGAAGAFGSADGAGTEARFRLPNGVAVDVAGNVYVADTGNSTIRRISPAGLVSTLAGEVGVPGSADGTGAQARFRDPQGLAVDAAGNVYVADNGNHAIRRITPQGAVSTIVGEPGATGFLPGALPGVISAPRGVAISGSSLYITMSKGVAVVRNLQ